MAKLIAQDLQPMLEAPGEVRVSCGRGEFLGEPERHLRVGDTEIGGGKNKGMEGVLEVELSMYEAR